MQHHRHQPMNLSNIFENQQKKEIDGLTVVCHMMNVHAPPPRQYLSRACAHACIKTSVLTALSAAFTLGAKACDLCVAFAL